MVCTRILRARRVLEICCATRANNNTAAPEYQSIRVPEYQQRNTSPHLSICSFFANGRLAQSRTCLPACLPAYQPTCFISISSSQGPFSRRSMRLIHSPASVSGSHILSTCVMRSISRNFLPLSCLSCSNASRAFLATWRQTWHLHEGIGSAQQPL